jgi:hypothetical protein
MMQSEKCWHFTSYPKSDVDFEVTHYFAVEGYIRAKATESRAKTARAHGDIQKAMNLDEAARQLRDRFRTS